MAIRSDEIFLSPQDPTCPDLRLLKGGASSQAELTLKEKIHGANVLVLTKNRVSPYEKLRIKQFSAVVVKGAVTDHAASTDYVPWVLPQEGTAPIRSSIELRNGRLSHYSGAKQDTGEVVNVLGESHHVVRVHNPIFVPETEDVDERIVNWASGHSAGITPIVGELADIRDVAERLGNYGDGIVGVIGHMMLCTLDEKPFTYTTPGSFS